ncbi:MAG: addiction module protein [Spirochaetales bacterium]|nr:addiction module protein [Spirochaetales bacterium]
MNSVIEQVLSNMTTEEKIILVEDIWDTIAISKESPKLTDAQVRKIKQREDNYLQRPETAKTWESFRSELETISLPNNLYP